MPLQRARHHAAGLVLFDSCVCKSDACDQLACSLSLLVFFQLFTGIKGVSVFLAFRIMLSKHHDVCKVEVFSISGSSLCSRCTGYHDQVWTQGKKTGVHHFERISVLEEHSAKCLAPLAMQPGLPERRPESSPCLIRILPPELWQVIFRRIDFVDFLSLVVAICCDPCEACVSHLQWISKAWKLLELDATERFLFALVAWAFPTIQLCVPSLCASRAADLGKLACTDPGSFWSSLRNHYGTIAMDLAVVSAQRLGVPNFLIEHALAEIAWELNFVQFGRMASKILDVDVRAQTYRRLVARYRIGPRSAAANVLAALEDNAPGRNQSFLALVVHDWDSWRKAEFYAVVNAALSDPQRLNRMFFMDQYVSRSIGT